MYPGEFTRRMRLDLLWAGGISFVLSLALLTPICLLAAASPAWTARHSRAVQPEVKFDAQPSRLRLTIEDDPDQICVFYREEKQPADTERTRTCMPLRDFSAALLWASRMQKAQEELDSHPTVAFPLLVPYQSMQGHFLPKQDDPIPVQQPAPQKERPR